jgi:hypothetical protein
LAEVVVMKEVLIYQDDFSKPLDENWWIEGGEKTWIENKELHVKADPPQKGVGGWATVWLKKELPLDIRIEVDCEVLHSHSESNNINFFISYADASGKGLEETKDQRPNSEYELYHELNGYIITFLNDKTAAERNSDGTNKARIRMRRCPGFQLLTEKYDYHAQLNVNYHFNMAKHGGKISLNVDGKDLLETTDLHPFGGGYFGFRTFRTYLKYKNLKIYEISP